MLTHITVKNLAIVDSLELEFDSGLSVLTGETGAGKSILIDALSLVLGDRADSSLVRTGAARADVTASFDLSKEVEIMTWLNANELLDDAEAAECLLRRSINSNGRSKGYINGQAVPLQLMREIGEQLINIHGQNSHQLLLKTQTQMTLLDEHGKLGHLKQELNVLSRSWKEKTAEFEDLNNKQQEQKQQIELLTYQLEELEQFAPVEGEIKSLEDNYKRLNNANEIINSLNNISQQLSATETYSSGTSNNNSGVQDVLSSCSKILNEIVNFDKQLSGIKDMLDQASIIIDEAYTEIRQHLDEVEPEPELLEELSERISLYYELSRKHQCEPARLHDILLQLQQQLSGLNHTDEYLEELQQQISHGKKTYVKQAEKLTAGRCDTAIKLAKLVEKHIHDLGMEQAKFSIDIVPIDSTTPIKDGLEKIHFMVATNPGQAMGLLSKIASGGELSRISLAIQVVTAEYNDTPTLIFDEIDVGVGGKIAEMIGAKLHLLATQAQILCVTHQAQVAAHGDHHYLVEKSLVEKFNDKQTISTIESLTIEQRIEEFSRMLAGANITPTTRSHAQELFEQAQGV